MLPPATTLLPGTAQQPITSLLPLSMPLPEQTTLLQTTQLPNINPAPFTIPFGEAQVAHRLSDNSVTQMTDMRCPLHPCNTFEVPAFNGESLIITLVTHVLCECSVSIGGRLSRSCSMSMRILIVSMPPLKRDIVCAHAAARMVFAVVEPGSNGSRASTEL